MQSCRKNLQRFFLHTLRCQESLLTPTAVGKTSGGFSYTLIRRHWTPKKIRNLGDLRKIIKISTKILRFGSDFDQDFGQFWISKMRRNSAKRLSEEPPQVFPTHFAVPEVFINANGCRKNLWRFFLHTYPSPLDT